MAAFGGGADFDAELELVDREIEAELRPKRAAEKALQSANVTLAQMWGFKIHDCTFPSQIMLWDETIKAQDHLTISRCRNQQKDSPETTGIRALNER